MYTITSRDKNYKPTHVSIDDGYMQTSRPFNPETDAWMEDQLDHSSFKSVVAGREAEWLIDEVNRLRRENFELKRIEKMYYKLIRL